MQTQTDECMELAAHLSEYHPLILLHHNESTQPPNNAHAYTTADAVYG